MTVADDGGLEEDVFLKVEKQLRTFAIPAEENWLALLNSTDQALVCHRCFLLGRERRKRSRY